MKLLGNRILVELVEKDENVTASGIFLGSERLNENTKNAIVKVVGDKCEFTKVGDRVMIPSVCNTTIEINDLRLTLISENEVICVL